MVITTCNLSTLTPYIPSAENPWDTQRANHLYRRLTYGINQGVIRAALAKDPKVIVDQLIDEAINLSPTPAPTWANIGRSQYEAEGLDFEDENGNNKEEWFVQVMTDQLNNGLRDVLTIFWLNHFVTQISEYNCSSFMYEYYNVLQEYSIGNFKEFVRRIGTTNAMLRFLSGSQNKKKKPNENYARELYELFTLGENNGYTQEDILESARALTGYNKSDGYCEFITFDETTFDDGTKTIFGRTGQWNYDDVIDILFEEKADLIAVFIVTKIYRYFVSPEVNDTVITELANDFKQDWEIAPILRKLFKSEHFFDENAFATIIKSPIDLTMNILKLTGFPVSEERMLNLYWQTGSAGQEFFQPVDVAGWQGDYKWINSSTLSGRWGHSMGHFWQVWGQKEDNNREKLRDFAKEASNNSRDVEVVVRSIIDVFLPKGLNTPSNYDAAIDIFKAEVPEEYFTNGIWTLEFEQVPWQTLLLFQYLVRIPEFQLK